MSSSADIESAIDPFAEECPPPPEFVGALVREIAIVNKKGLHARATAKFVQCVEGFDADIKVTRCGETVGGTSIMAILTLGAGMGSSISVSAVGPQAAAALDAIAALVASRFGEDE
ncbi:MAG: HPr family phosphocarrier protein [Methylobacteriaceae bacterium]|nr:HPr family phosphocarrier protein [Methylobacteriaceae bacterium]MBV9218883.1 HPr family phosphocarrier protein [Methylobacteriaceae bacterium]MBV9245928.1 HPr family phosphocarrier protein [Methylobacteriaceae bacterium]MBV9705166.1 HPr family phosphocarrier protein [Methylobacteriaceae bacterium]